MINLKLLNLPFFISKLRLFFYSLILLSCGADNQPDHSVTVNNKIKGVTYTGPANGPIPPHMISSSASAGSNFIAFVPEGTVYRQNLNIHYNKTGGWFGESMEASIQGIELARKNGLKVMLKPHLTVGYDRSNFDLDWRSRASDSLSRREYIKQWRNFVEKQPDKLRSDESWRGFIMPKNESDWNTLAENYTEYILEYARLADSLDVEMFSIGTELKAMALEKPDYWKELIKKVKEVYSGKLTYAANWDSYKEIEFWDQLDFIGIDAYFPLSEKSSPEIPSLVDNWKPYKEEIREFSRKFNKPILFTEWGYESEDYAGETPWEAEGREFSEGRPQTNEHINLNAQANLYEATFQTFWEEPWFAGVFIWRWSPPRELNREIKTYNYSPIGKPAEDTLSKWFGKTQDNDNKPAKSDPE